MGIETSGPVVSVARVIGEARDALTGADIYCLLQHVVGRGREFLLAHPDYILSNKELSLWKECKNRRLEGGPCAYITGSKEFYSLLFEVDSSTLIPRPETELLVDEIIDIGPASVLDVGTGCGNIAVAVKHHLRECTVVALDVSREALRIARRNARRVLGGNVIKFIHGSYFESLSGTRYDVIVSNPPYIKRADIETLQREIRDYEPLIALDGGEDGLDGYRIILKGGAGFLADGGRIVLEIDERLLRGIRFLAEENGYILKKIEKDLSGRDRMVVLGKK